MEKRNSVRLLLGFLVMGIFVEKNIPLKMTRRSPEKFFSKVLTNLQLNCSTGL